MVKKEELLKDYEQAEPRNVSKTDFPPNFVFGVATSAYQIEGACEEGNRGASIWDDFTHTEGKIIDKSNGDVTVDHYHRYKEDIDLIAKLGFDAYRFSISWSRIFPDGLGTKINMEGITFYNNIIDALLQKGIQPYVTLYHWDLPLHLHESMGGWLNKEIVKYFEIYADTCFASFGDRVKNWITINEPLQTAVNGYCTGIFAPGRHQHSSTEPYLVAHHQILAHAAAFSVYQRKYKDKQGGNIGLVVDCEWAEANSDKIEDKSAAARRLDFQIGWYLHPIYYGDYPEVMRNNLGDQLPKFMQKDKELAASEWLYVVPWGLRKVLNYIAKTYNNPPIYVTENGMDDEENDSSPLHEMLDDKLRVRYFKGYLSAVAQAIKDGADVRGYFVWSLLDNFEWAQGYTKRFGLVYVDYKNGLVRHPKSSAYWFMRFLKGNEEKNGKEE
ncbi:Beta-glucosidase 42 [Citrus sinensis]|uniref:Beta-glucosidase 42 n=1 Tax=Citrus sinensis TaxID=2711 RepID=A0ACB8NAZ1_CITSI|nr:Beta-glucosidase 42 [Citrus sinensis]